MITPGDDTKGFVANFATGIVSFEDTRPSGNIYKYRFTAGTEIPIPPALPLRRRSGEAIGRLGLIGYRRRKLGST